MTPPTEIKTLADALMEQIQRVRDELMPAYIAIGPPGASAMAFICRDLDAATKALAEGDAVACLRAYKALKESQ